VYFKAEEPTCGGLASLGYAFEHFVGVNAAVVAHRQFFAVHKIHTRRLRHQATHLAHPVHGLEGTWDELDEAAVRGCLWEVALQGTPYAPLVVVLKALVAAVVVVYQYAYHLAQRQPRLAPALTLLSRKTQPIQGFEEIICPDEYLKQLLLINFDVHRPIREHF